MAHINSVSVLICTYNRAELLAQTLEALARATAPDACAVEIVVVDNNSTDDTAAIVRRAAALGPRPVQYVHERQQGKSFALNAGLLVSQGDIIALTDDDVLPSADWLVRIISNFRNR